MRRGEEALSRRWWGREGEDVGDDDDDGADHDAGDGGYGNGDNDDGDEVKCLDQEGFKQLDQQVVGEHVDSKRCFKTFSRGVSKENHEN